MNSAKMNSNSNKAITTEEWFEEQDYDADESWNKVLDDAEAFFSVDFCEESHKAQHDELYELWKDFQANCCDDCEGKCRSDETESCEKCSIELRIGCGNNPSDHSIFNGFCDDCREE